MAAVMNMAPAGYPYWTIPGTGAAWLDQPVELHSDRTMPMCELTPEQCAFKEQWGLNWYQADYHYSLTVIAFMLAMIALFTIGALANIGAPKSWRKSGLFRKLQSTLRSLAYTHYRVGLFGWYSPSLGVILTGVVGFIFFMGLMLGKRPYYWPNTEEVNFGDSMPIATRTGWMSIALLPFVLVLGAKENPVTMLTRVPYEKLNVFHRWISWAMYVFALVHTFPFIIGNLNSGVMGEMWATMVFYWTGVVALAAQSWMMFMSIGPIRNRFYETFKALHLIMAAIFFIFLFIHCDFRLTSWDYLIAAASIYALCTGASLLRTFFEYGPSPRRAHIELLPHNTVKVSIRTTSTWTAGQHVFLRFLSKDVHSFTAHPFTIASLPTSTHHSSPADVSLTPNGHIEHSMSFFVHPRKGFTSRLAALAKLSPDRTVSLLLDGPYGGIKDQPLSTFDRALVISGGAGAGFALGVVEEVLRNRPAATRDLRVVFATRIGAHADWFRETLAELLRRYEAHGVQVDVHVTSLAGDDAGKVGYASEGEAESRDRDGDVEGEGEKKPDQIETSKAQEHSDAESSFKVPSVGHARPVGAQVVREATMGLNGSVGIAVCGPESMLFDVRNAAAGAQRGVGRDGLEEVYLHSECFGW